MENTGQFELKESPVKKLAKEARLKADADKKAKLEEIEKLKAKSSFTNAERDKLLLYLLNK